MLAAGCNSKDDSNVVEATPTPTVTAEDTTSTEGTEIEEPEYLENELVKGEYKLEDYINLGQYKGIEVSVAPVSVSDEDIYIAIQSELGEYGAPLVEVTGRAVKLGDTVNIDYEGLKDGIAFDGGTGTNYDLRIGSGSFIPGFEDGLIGAKTGDKLDLDITFPENYGTEELAGQPVVFKVTVNMIQEYQLTEDYVTTNTEYKNVEEYLAGAKDDLMEEKEASRQAEIENSVYNSIVEGSTISSLPQTLLDYYKNDIKVYYTNFAMAYGMEFADFLSASGVTEEQFDADATEYAKNMATRDLVYGAIIKAENIELSDEEYVEQVAAIATEYGYDNPDDLLATADEKLLREEVLVNKVIDFLVAEAIVK